MIEVRKFLLRTRVTVPEGERAIVLLNGKLDTILRPGRHFFTAIERSVTVEAHALKDPVFNSGLEDALRQSRPDLVAGHFTEVRTGAQETAVIYRDGKLFWVVKPDSRTLLWTDAGPWNIETVDVSSSLAVPEALAQRIIGSGTVDRVKRFGVEEGQVGLLYIEGAFAGRLEPGMHSFWNVGRTVNVKIVDTRQHALDVTGQEVLTRDKVSIRVNLVARYRVTDPVKAVASVKDYADALYRALQHAFRESLATKTLDELLSRKGDTDAEAAAAGEVRNGGDRDRGRRHRHQGRDPAGRHARNPEQGRDGGKGGGSQRDPPPRGDQRHAFAAQHREGDGGEPGDVAAEGTRSARKDRRQGPVADRA